MDESSALSSRSAAMDALSNLSAAHARLLSLATGLVERLFPGDGSTRDEAIMPFANLAFIAVTKARADLDSYSKSFAEVLKTVDVVRPPPTAGSGSSAVAAPVTVPVIASSQATQPPAAHDVNTQVESVGALKRKYEEGMAAAANVPVTSPGAPKKSGPGPKRPAGVPKGSNLPHAMAPPQLSVPANPKSPPVTRTPSTETLSAPPTTLPPLAPSSAALEDKTTSPVNVEAENSESSAPISPKSVTTAVPAETPIPAESSTLSTTTTTVPATTSAETTTSSTPSTPSAPKPTKEAYKKALEGMVLPNRKKHAGIPTSSSPGPSTSLGASEQSEENKSKTPASGDVSLPPPTVVGAATTAHGRGSASSSTKEANGGGGTSDDEISSDEEEYLRGVEERRARAAAEKEEKAKAAREAREARQGMYAFLTEEPPPGFITAKTTAGPSKEKKPKKERKDKARDKLVSRGSSSTLDASVDKKSQGSTSSPLGSTTGASPTTPSKRSNGAKEGKESKSASHARVGSDLDLSSSPTSSTAQDNARSSTPTESWTTRYRPSNLVDESVWRGAEDSIRSGSTAGRKRWEEHQLRHAAKTEAAKSDSMSKKQMSTLNVKGPLASLKNATRRLTGSTDSLPPLLAPDSPRRKSNADDSPRRKSNTDESPRRKSNASDDVNAEPERRPRSDSKKLPKLDIIDDPRIFLFEAPETEANLRFMEKNGEEVLAGGTIEKLIQRLTSHSDPSPEYFQSFMLTYHNFLTPQELIELLRLRWNSQPSDPAMLDQFLSNHMFPIRLRIVNVLKMWIEYFGSDFKDELAKDALNSFLTYIRGEYPQMADMVASKLKRHLAGQFYLDGESEIDEDPPTPIPIAEGKELNPLLTDIHPEEFARQMTLVEHALFKAIPYKELLTNAKAGKKNPNVANMISYTNHLVNWIGTQILKQEDAKSRAVVLARFITIAKCCIHSCQNYNGAMEILSALRTSAVFRLKHTWNLLPDTIWDDYDWLETLFESDGNYSRYRHALGNAVPPCVPYLGRYLSEMLFLNEIHPDYLSQGPPPVINYAKMILVADILHHLQRYQKNPFCLTGVPIIQRFFLLKRGVLNEKDLYKISLEREPRESAAQTAS